MGPGLSLRLQSKVSKQRRGGSYPHERGLKFPVEMLLARAACFPGLCFRVSTCKDIRSGMPTECQDREAFEVPCILRVFNIEGSGMGSVEQSTRRRSSRLLRGSAACEPGCRRTPQLPAWCWCCLSLYESAETRLGRVTTGASRLPEDRLKPGADAAVGRRSWGSPCRPLSALLQPK